MLQGDIADVVAVVVIHRLEVVDIQHGDRERITVAPGTFDFLLGLFGEVAAVRQASQGVGRGLRVQRLLTFAVGGDVANDLDEPGVGALRIAHDVQGCECLETAIGATAAPVLVAVVAVILGKTENLARQAGGAAGVIEQRGIGLAHDLIMRQTGL